MKQLLRFPAFLWAIPFLFLAGCANDKKESEKTNSGEGAKESAGKETMQLPEAIKVKEDKAMAIHDSIMPQMDSLRRVKGQLEKRLKQSKSGAQAAELKSTINDLNKANDKMMNWMGKWTKQYKRVADTLSVARRRERVDTLFKEVKALEQIWEKSLQKGADLVTEQKNN